VYDVCTASGRVPLTFTRGRHFSHV